MLTYGLLLEVPVRKTIRPFVSSGRSVRSVTRKVVSAAADIYSAGKMDVTDRGVMGTTVHV